VNQNNEAPHRRLARLWGIAPYRVEIVGSWPNRRLYVDGRDLTPEQTRILAADTRRHRLASNRALN
jgi:hypothetical protein